MVQITCEQAIQEYLAYLKMEAHGFADDGECVITTPFVRPDGEGIEVALRPLPDGRVSITDMGNSLGYLFVNGLSLSRTLLNDARGIAKSHSVALQRNHLVMHTRAEAVGMAMHGLIQATLGVSDLIHKRRPSSRALFDDEVESLIIMSGVTYDVGFPVRGQREQHTVKFHVDSARNLLVHPLSAAGVSAARSWAERLAYRFIDIRAASPQWRPVALLDDRKNRADVWTNDTLAPIQDSAIKWSQREVFETMLRS